MIEEGYTQEVLAKTVGVALVTLNTKLNGHRDWTMPEGKRIAKTLNRTLDELFL
ncbi:MAG TPA: helix-turn-helix domain-containing protein [Bacteroidales bacterium]|nr:helix-turn-helix domain-containing protein [Bacteroidales bacterium]